MMDETVVDRHEDRVHSGLDRFDMVFQRHGCHFTCG